MSAYDNYRNRIKEMASKLPGPKKITQNTLWLKASITERLKQDVDILEVDGELYVGKGDTFGFKEETVNQIIQYAYEAGKKKSDEDNKEVIKDMESTIQNVLDEVIHFLD